VIIGAEIFGEVGGTWLACALADRDVNAAKNGLIACSPNLSAAAAEVTT
jgi:hypothetical protein